MNKGTPFGATSMSKRILKRVMLQSQPVPAVVCITDWPKAVVVSKPGALLEVKRGELPGSVRRGISELLAQRGAATGRVESASF